MKTILLAYRGIIFREIQKQKVPFLVVQELDPETKEDIGLPKEISFVNCRDAMVFEYSKEPSFAGLNLKPIAHSGLYDCTFFGPYAYQSITNSNDYALDNRIITLLNHCFAFPEEDAKIEWIRDYNYIEFRASRISKKFRESTKRYLIESCLAYYKDLYDIHNVIITNDDMLNREYSQTNTVRVRDLLVSTKIDSKHWLEFTEKCIKNRSEFGMTVVQFNLSRDKLKQQIDQFDKLIESCEESEI